MEMCNEIVQALYNSQSEERPRTVLNRAQHLQDIGDIVERCEEGLISWVLERIESVVQQPSVPHTIQPPK